MMEKARSETTSHKISSLMRMSIKTRFRYPKPTQTHNLAKTQYSKKMLPPSQNPNGQKCFQEISKSNIERLDTLKISSKHLVPDAFAPRHLLFAKAVADRRVYPGALKNAIDQSWRLARTVDVKELERNIFIISFGSDEDKKKAWENRPGIAQKIHIILKQWRPFASLESLAWSRSSVWVQIKAIPFALITEELAMEVGARIGIVEELDLPEYSGEIASLMRLRISFEVNEPILTGFYLERDDEYPIWIQLFYERVGLFCYGCGLLGHDNSRCQTHLVLPSDDDPLRMCFVWGPWLNVPAIYGYKYKKQKPTQGINHVNHAITINEPQPEVPTTLAASSEKGKNIAPPGFEVEAEEDWENQALILDHIQDSIWCSEKGESSGTKMAEQEQVENLGQISFGPTENCFFVNDQSPIDSIVMSTSPLDFPLLGGMDLNANTVLEPTEGVFADPHIPEIQTLNDNPAYLAYLLTQSLSAMPNQFQNQEISVEVISQEAFVETQKTVSYTCNGVKPTVEEIANAESPIMPTTTSAPTQVMSMGDLIKVANDKQQETKRKGKKARVPGPGMQKIAKKRKDIAGGTPMAKRLAVQDKAKGKGGATPVPKLTGISGWSMFDCDFNAEFESFKANDSGEWQMVSSNAGAGIKIKEKNVLVKKEAAGVEAGNEEGGGRLLEIPVGMSFTTDDMFQANGIVMKDKQAKKQKGKAGYSLRAKGAGPSQPETNP